MHGVTDGVGHWLRKAATGERSWESYWQTVDAPYRTWLVDALRRLPAFGSLLEVGCGPGVNLWRVRQAFPDVTVGGFDVSAAAIESGHARFTAAEQAGELPGCGDVYLAVGELPAALTRVEPADVILSCYALAYVRPRDFLETMTALVDLARQAIVLVEPTVVVGDPAGVSQQLRASPDEFKHDYLGFFRACAPTWSVSIRPFSIQNANRIIVAQPGASA